MLIQTDLFDPERADSSKPIISSDFLDYFCCSQRAIKYINCAKVGIIYFSVENQYVSMHIHSAKVK